MLAPSVLRRARLALAPVLVAPVLAFASASPALADSGIQCANDGSYGSSCISIHGKGLRIGDLQSWFVPPNRDYLTHRRWAQHLTRYRCNPIHRTRAECPPVQSWYSRSRKGNPPKNSTFCTVLEPEGVGFSNCVDSGVGYADAHLGDFSRFRVPRHYHQTQWFCTEMAVRVGRHWRNNGVPGTAGVRGCAEVHS